MPPKRASDLERCHVNWPINAGHSFATCFPTRIPLPVGGLPPPSFALRSAGSKRQHFLTDDPVPAPVLSRKPKSLQQHNVRKPDETVLELPVPQAMVGSLDRSLTPPTLQPPEICAQARSSFRSQKDLSKDAKSADLYGLLQPRPKSAGPVPVKGAGKTRIQNAVRKTLGKTAASPDLCSYIVLDGQRHNLCQRFQQNRCTSKSCKYKHLCAAKVGGKPCGKTHAAADHPQNS